MPTITKLKDGVLAVTGLPEGIVDIQGHKEAITFYESGYGTHRFNLPPGSWKVLGWSDELTEEQCELIVERIFVTNDSKISYVDAIINDYLFKDYERPNWVFIAAKSSFASLLRSHSITEKALIIVNGKK